MNLYPFRYQISWKTAFFVINPHILSGQHRRPESLLKTLPYREDKQHWSLLEVLFWAASAIPRRSKTSHRRLAATSVYWRLKHGTLPFATFLLFVAHLLGINFWLLLHTTSLLFASFTHLYSVFAIYPPKPSPQTSPSQWRPPSTITLFTLRLTL